MPMSPSSKAKCSFIFLLLLLFCIALSCALQFWIAPEKGFDDKRESQQTCRSLLDEDMVRNLCPSSRDKDDLRVTSEVIVYEQNAKCSLSITASDSSTMIVTIDIFEDHDSAGLRMRERMQDGVDTYGINLLDAQVYGNLLGLGEVSALDERYNSRNLLLWSDYTYAEVMPTGGGLCAGEELYDFGRYLYSRLTDFEPFAL